MSVSSSPYTDVTVTFTNLSSYGLYLKNSIASTITFTNSTPTSQNYTICALGSAATNTDNTQYFVGVIITGTDRQLFTLNSSNTTTPSFANVSVEVNPSSTTTPVYTINYFDGGRTSSISTDTEGTLYYFIRDNTDTYAPTTIVPNDLKTQLFNRNTPLNLHNQSEFLTYLYTGNRYIHMNKTYVYPGRPNFIQLQRDMVPEIPYIFSNFFENYAATATSTPTVSLSSSPISIADTWPAY